MVSVVVVGDLARSPRMLNHAAELARAGYPVLLVGHRQRDFDPPEGVRICELPYRPRITARSRLVFLAASALRMGRTFFDLLSILWRERPRTILVQNPPSFPTLIAARIAARRLVVDWHNYGYSMLGLRLGASHWFTRAASRYEGAASRVGDRHFCVSDAMRVDLQRRFGITAATLYDRPLCGMPAVAQNSERLVAVCPAGWTGDEDIGMLLDALKRLQRRDIEVYITGDGPLRSQMKSGFAVQTGFLDSRRYWQLLARSGVGISMHRSSSGLDLAMKVVDLYSAGVPVCAFDYGGALPEQVRDGETGWLFRDAAGLAAILERLQRNPGMLESARDHIRREWTSTWSAEWERVALPVFRALEGQ